MRRVVSVTAGMLLAITVRAQTPPEPGHTRFGIGVSLAPAAIVLSSSQQSSYVPIGLGDLFFPVLVDSGFKLEAELGLLRSSSETSSYGSSYDETATSFRIGAGAFKVWPLGHTTTNAYLGPRVLLVSTSTSITYPTSPEQTVKETDWVIGLALGAEHFLSPHFSLGGELQLNYTVYGNPEESPNPGSQPSASHNMLSTNGLLLLRAYF